MLLWWFVVVVVVVSICFISWRSCSCAGGGEFGGVEQARERDQGDPAGQFAHRKAQAKIQVEKKRLAEVFESSLYSHNFVLALERIVLADFCTGWYGRAAANLLFDAAVLARGHFLHVTGVGEI